MFLILKNGRTNSIILFIFLFVINKVEENLDSIIWSIDRQHKIAGSLFEKAANEYDFLNINNYKIFNALITTSFDIFPKYLTIGWIASLVIKL